jgi:hypothetical protein
MIQAKRDRRAKLQAERTDKPNAHAASPDTEPCATGVKLSDENVDPATNIQGQKGGNEYKKKRFWTRRRYNNRRKSNGNKKQENGNQTTVTDGGNDAVRDTNIKVEHEREGTASCEGTAVETATDAKAPLVTTAEVSTVSA